MTRLAISTILLGSYLVVIIPFTSYLRNKPFVEKLGFIPTAEVLKFVSADQRIAVANALVMKALFYYGSLTEKSKAKINIPPDYYSIYKTIETSVQLDPYNMDAYYFSQAILVWEVGRVQEVNTLMEFGMRYRNWDYYLPYFAGFNYAYFLKDYKKAALFYRRAADLTGDPLFTKLAGRYLYESGSTDKAIAYLKVMAVTTKDRAIRDSFKIRIKAFELTKRIEEAVLTYTKINGKLPSTVNELVVHGFLQKAPVDPYGGLFFLTQSGQVRSTSNFSVGGDKGERH